MSDKVRHVGTSIDLGTWERNDSAHGTQDPEQKLLAKEERELAKRKEKRKKIIPPLETGRSRFGWTWGYLYGSGHDTVEIEVDTTSEGASDIYLGLTFALAFARSRNRARCRIGFPTEIRILAAVVLSENRAHLHDPENPTKPVWTYLENGKRVSPPKWPEITPKDLARRFGVPARSVRHLIASFRRFRQDREKADAVVDSVVRSPFGRWRRRLAANDLKRST